MAVRYPITLNVSEPNNNIGLLKIRQADEETQTLVVQILEDAIPKSYDGLQVFFCARIGQTPGLGIIEQKLTEDEMTDPKKGKLEYTFRSEDWQVLGRQTGYFSFRKMVDDHTYEQQFSTRDFTYEVTKNIYSDGIKEITKDGSTYVWTIEDLIRLFNEYIATGKTDWEEFVEQNKEILESVDPGGQILSELIRSRKPAGGSKTYPDLPARLDQQIGLNEDFRSFDDSSFMKRVYNETLERGINVKWFGAVGDGVHDDLPAFQAAIDYLPEAGGKIVIPRPKKNYLFNTTHPDYEDKQLVINKNSVELEFETNGDVEVDNGYLASGIEVDSVIFVEEGVRNFTVNKGYIHCKGVSKYGIKSEKFISRIKIDKLRILQPKNEGIHAIAWMAYLSGVEVQNSGGSGFYVAGDVDNSVQGTSVSFQNCYSINAASSGFHVELMTYSSFTSCGVDHSPIGYQLVRTKGFSLISNGAENCINPVKCNGCEFGVIEGLSLPTMASDTDAIVELTNSMYIKIGTLFNNALTFKSKVRLKERSSVVITDYSIAQGHIDNQSTYSEQEPVEFLVGKARRAQVAYQALTVISAWTGNVSYRKDDTGKVSVYADLVGGNVTEITPIATLPGGNRPRKNMPINAIETETGKVINNGFYISANDGNIRVAKGSTLSYLGKYSFVCMFDGGA